jgi:hypothetical protein
MGWKNRSNPCDAAGVTDEGFDAQTGLELRIHPGIKRSNGVPPGCFRGIKRKVRVLEKSMAAGAVAGSEGDTIARCGREIAAVHQNRLGQRRQKPGPHGLGRLRTVDLALRDDELVPAEARHEIVLARLRVEALRGHAHDLVPDIVAKRVVHVLEMVEIHVVERNPFACCFGGDQQLFETLHEGSPVEKPSERVVVSHVADALVGPLLLLRSPVEGAARHSEGQRRQHGERDGRERELLVEEGLLLRLIEIDFGDRHRGRRSRPEDTFRRRVAGARAACRA